ncbi:hypothetical protein [Thalassotalea maritima]|uniref:hypothetical protein n=1 Tax=Thalassotalea maritima TaxID=3242416 RepID=UPI00352746B2
MRRSLVILLVIFILVAISKWFIMTTEHGLDMNTPQAIDSQPSLTSTGSEIDASQSLPTTKQPTADTTKTSQATDKNTSSSEPSPTTKEHTESKPQHPDNESFSKAVNNSIAPLEAASITIKTSLESLSAFAWQHSKNQPESTTNSLQLYPKSSADIIRSALQITPYFGLEADYDDFQWLQQNPSPLFSPGSDLNAVLVNVKGSVPLGNSSSLFAKFGIGAWLAEQQDSLTQNALTPAMNQLNSNIRYGTDVFYGVGYEFDYDDYIFTSQWQVFEIEGQQYEIYSIGGGFRF